MKAFHLLASVLCVVALSVSSASQAEMTLKGKHKEMNFACETCHGQTKPREIPDEQVCLNCHGSRDAIKAKTSKLNPNPHYGHDDSIECGACHKQHEDSVLACNQCHKFEYKVP